MYGRHAWLGWLVISIAHLRAGLSADEIEYLVTRLTTVLIEDEEPEDDEDE